LTVPHPAAKAEYQAARFVHYHAAAARALQEVVDLSCLAAAYAEGIALSRARHLASGRAWPLGSRSW
jgi:hypothetical protein